MMSETSKRMGNVAVALKTVSVYLKNGNRKLKLMPCWMMQVQHISMLMLLQS